MKLIKGWRPWTIISVVDNETEQVVATMDIDGTGDDEEFWLMRWALRKGYGRPAHSFWFDTEMREDD